MAFKNTKKERHMSLLLNTVFLLFLGAFVASGGVIFSQLNDGRIHTVVNQLIHNQAYASKKGVK